MEEKVEATPAGAQQTSPWNDLQEGVASLAKFVESSGTKEAKADWCVVFRCGTVARVTLGTDPEFEGYTDQNYVIPRPPKNAREMAKDAATIGRIMAYNRKVWSVQKEIAGSTGKAVRQAYKALLAQGYQFPGVETSDRQPMHTGIRSSADDSASFWVVFWPKLDPTGRIFNIAFAPTSAAAASATGDLRRQDYLFPEVAAVITAARKICRFGSDGKPGKDEASAARAPTSALPGESCK